MIKTGMTLAACSMEQIDAALASHVQALILMNSSILDLMQPALQKKRSKPVFLHIDLFLRGRFHTFLFDRQIGIGIY